MKRTWAYIVSPSCLRATQLTLLMGAHAETAAVGELIASFMGSEFTATDIGKTKVTDRPDPANPTSHGE